MAWYEPGQVPRSNRLAERATLLPIGINTYGGAEWAVPNALMAPYEAFWGAGDAAARGDWREAGRAGLEAGGAAMTGGMAFTRPAGSLGMAGRIKSERINGYTRGYDLRPVEVPGITRPQFALDENMHPVFNIPPRQEWEKRVPVHNPGPRLFRYIDEFFTPDDGLFFRTTRNKNDIKYLKSGTHRGSINHHTGEPENGLSVARIPEVADGYKYGYLVKGDVIRHGSDGEPVLDLKSATAQSDLMALEKLFAIEQQRRAQRLQELGLDYDDYITLRTGTPRMLNIE